MHFIADFHIHSKYSRATSPKTDLEHLSASAKIKGIKVLGTGDFTHPLWLREMKEKLEPAEPGMFRIRNQESGIKDNGTRFILSSEISCIYKKNDKVRKIHILILAPSFKAVERINAKLNAIGNLKSDGRPILGLDAKELAKIIFEASSDCIVIPAHLMTPWFSLFGSKSGFNSLEECFEEYSKYIYAGETGLSANPEMLWTMPDGRRLTLISNSDCHSPEKIGREANVFNTDLSYFAIKEALQKKDKTKFLFTIEFFPEEGKYHYDGHRVCDIVFNPEQTKKHNGICPVCKKPLVVGVSNRVAELADKPFGFKPKNAIPYKSLVPLRELIGEALGVGPNSKKVDIEYQKIIKNCGSELEVLLDMPIQKLKEKTLPNIALAIDLMRQGKVQATPGYDGVYGKIKVLEGLLESKKARQPKLIEE
ncbi:MAG: endonuclease Q family protein [Candidatus Pacebacteria bacterium]|nr:endonuclease Q family protein [Candidatus Paceibacterota bacterium]